MDQQEFNNSILDFVSGNLSADKTAEFEQYILIHPELKEEFEAQKKTWLQLQSASIPNPSKNMDQAFYQVLEAESQQLNLQEPSLWKRINAFLDEASIQISVKQLAFGFALLALGVFIGTQFNTGNTQPEPMLSSSQAETEAIRSELVMLLIDQPSASKRLQAVNEANKLNDATELIIQALLKTLNHDPNSNVRLAALESLVNYVDIPEVREGLASSISHQNSPLVQIALAELMVKLQEKGSIESLKKLLERPEVDQTVKQKIEESILQI